MTHFYGVVRFAAICVAAMGICMGAGAAPAPRAAASAPTSKADVLRLGINEAATEIGVGHSLYDQYASLASLLGRLSGKKVVIEAYTSVPLFRKKYDAGEFDFAFGKSVHVVARGVVAGTYVPLAKNEEPYVAGFVVTKGSTIHNVKDLRGKTVLLPPSETFTTALIETYLKEQGLPFVDLDKVGDRPGDKMNVELPRSDVIAVRHFDGQINVAKAISSGLFPAGAVNSSVIKSVEQGPKDGLRLRDMKDTELMEDGPGVKVLAKLKPQPNWFLVANKNMSKDVVQKVADALSATYTNEEGKAVLKDMRCKKLVHAEKDEYVALIKYLYPDSAP